MTRVLLVTNDFPPRPGGIQVYLEALTTHLAELGGHTLTVYAPKWKRAEEYDRRAPFEIVRHPGSLMLPVPDVDTRMRKLIGTLDIETVWFGAAAPLGLLGGRARRAGAGRVLASTHGHEVGWSMFPLGRSALRRIGRDSDVVTYISHYTRDRFASAFGPQTALEHLPPGVDVERFHPDAATRTEMRAHYGLGERPVIVCLSRLVPRKGQDMLIRALPLIRSRVDGATLVIVGGGPYLETLRKLAGDTGVGEQVIFTQGVPSDQLPAHHAMADVFAMPCRTRGAGLDVEGLGIVYLEASATGVPVIAGKSGGAPETVQEGRTGFVVDGRSVDQIADAVSGILADPDLAKRMGAAGRRWAVDQWRWQKHTARLSALLSG
ncbi:MAG TPA: glycosyltransferase family 4 protein [Mycobacterium sp.]|nr:glycosyltransferase family 4 protein [Mycobacterium sp.]